MNKKSFFFFTILSGMMLMTANCAPVIAQPSADNWDIPVTVSLDIPSSVEFCGKKISLERYDMRERFDREQLAFMYMHSTSMQLIKRANRFFPIIEPILKANGIPDDFKYLAVVESALDVRALSPVKAAGIWQFMDDTGKRYGLEINSEVDERYHVEKSTVAACKYLKEAYDKYGDWATVAASYNAGTQKISAEQDKQSVSSSFDMLLVPETSRYVFRILAAKRFLENPKQFGFFLKKEHLYHDIRTDEVKVTGPVPDWSEWARQYGITYSQLKDFNVWLRDRGLTNKTGKTYIISIPKKEDLNFDVRKIRVYNKNWVVD